MSSKDGYEDDTASRSTIGHEVLLSPTPDSIQSSVDTQENERLSKLSSTNSDYYEHITSVSSRGQVSTLGSVSSEGSKSRSSNGERRRKGEKRSVTIGEVEEEKGQWSEKREHAKRNRTGEERKSSSSAERDKSKRKSSQGREGKKKSAKSEDLGKHGIKASTKTKSGYDVDKDVDDRASIESNRTRDSEQERMHTRSSSQRWSQGIQQVIKDTESADMFKSRDVPSVVSTKRTSSERWSFALKEIRSAIRSKDGLDRIKGNTRLGEDRDENLTRTSGTGKKGHPMVKGEKSNEAAQGELQDPLHGVIRRTQDKGTRESEVLAVKVPVTGARDLVGEYLMKHKIGELFDTFLMALLKVKPDKPADFLHNMARDLNRQRKDVKTAESIGKPCLCEVLVKALATD